MKLFAPLLLIVVISSQTACQLVHSTLSRRAHAESAQRKQTPRPKRERDEPKYRAYKATLREKLNQQDHDWLAKELVQLQQSRERLPGGYWKLRLLVKTVSQPDGGEEAPDASWENHIARLQKWATGNPKSVVAQLGLAASWQGYAWKARGHGYADDVKPADWELFRDRLSHASQVLADARSVAANCPEYYVISQELALSQGWDRADYEALFEQAVAVEPTYYYFYQAKASYLLPRWYGEEGEWEKFIEEAANKLGGDKGDALFFEVYAHMLRIHGLDFMNTHQKYAKRMMNGYRQIEKLYGTEPGRLNEASLISIFSGDSKTAAELMNQIGDNFDEELWKSKENFDVFRKGVIEIEQRQN